MEPRKREEGGEEPESLAKEEEKVSERGGGASKLHGTGGEVLEKKTRN